MPFFVVLKGFFGGRPIFSDDFPSAAGYAVPYTGMSPCMPYAAVCCDSFRSAARSANRRAALRKRRTAAGWGRNRLGSQQMCGLRAIISFRRVCGRVRAGLVRAAWREPYPADRARCIAGAPTEKTARGRARRPISANGPRVFHCRSGGCMETTFVISRARGIPEQTAVNFLRRIFRGRARSADADRRYPRAMSFARVVRKPAKSCAKVVSLLTFCASSVILIKIDAAFTQTAATRGMPEAAAGSW